MSLVRHDSFLAIDQTLQKIEATLVPQIMPSETQYEYIPLPLGEFVNGMKVALDDLSSRYVNDPTFLDAGCGVGTKMILATYMGFIASGFEMEQAYVDVAKRLFDLDVLVANAFDYTEYDRFDVVYSYRLCRDIEHQQELNAHIVSHMKPGALYFCAGSNPRGLTEHVHESGIWRVP